VQQHPLSLEHEDDFALERELKQDIPRILPHLNITAESLESRGALYEPVVRLIKCYQAYRPEMSYNQPML
jgi:hypothetical protein